MKVIEIKGRLTACADVVDRKTILNTAVVDGRYVIEFGVNEFGQPAGRIECYPVLSGVPNAASDSGWTPEDFEEFSYETGVSGGVLGDSFTRDGVTYWSRGFFTPTA